MDDASQHTTIHQPLDASPQEHAEDAVVVTPDGSSDLDQCGDEMLDTVDSVVSCVNQNHVELQHEYEETQPPLEDASQQQVAMVCSSEAQSCGAAEPLTDMMMLPDSFKPHDMVKKSSTRSLYQCQECSATQVLRQLQPDVRETIWWPCDQCEKDCRWNPVTEGPLEQDGCTIQ